MPFRKQGSPYWQYDRSFSIKGKRYRVRGSTGERSKTAARDVEEAEVRVARLKVLHGESKPSISLHDAMGTYASNVAIHQPSWRTTKSQAQILLNGLKNNQTISSIDNAQLTAYVARRRATVANATVNREIQLLRRVLNYAGENLNMQLPTINWKAHILKEPHGRVRELTIAEEALLFKYLRSDLHGLVEFCIATGCRIGTAIKLEWRDIDFGSRVIVFRKMKGDEHHAIPMTNSLLALLANQPRAHKVDQVFTYLFRGNERKRRRFTRSGWKKPWQQALLDARIPDFRFHDLRHTALSRITRTNGIAAAQKLAGHSDISTTARYAHVQMDDLLKAMEESSAAYKEKALMNG